MENIQDFKMEGIHKKRKRITAIFLFIELFSFFIAVWFNYQFGLAINPDSNSVMNIIFSLSLTFFFLSFIYKGRRWAAVTLFVFRFLGSFQAFSSVKYMGYVSTIDTIIIFIIAISVLECVLLAYLLINTEIRSSFDAIKIEAAEKKKTQ